MTTPLSSPSQPINKIQRFEDFYRLFQESPGVHKYQDQINDIYAKGGNSLIFLFEDLLAYDPDIAEMLRKDPEALLEDAVEAFKNLLKFQGATLSNQDYFVRITTKDKKSPLFRALRELRAKNISTLVWSKGILVRSSIIRPKIIKAFFECILCGAQFEVIQLTSRIRLPKFCTNKRCKAKAQSDFRLISKNSEFIDWQSVMIQEIPEDLPPGRIPRSVQAILTHDLVDTVKPGDRVTLMGIYKSVIAQSTKNYNSTLFKTYFDINFIDPEDKSEEAIDLTKEDKKKIVKLSKEPFIQKKIARSIAPDIYGREDLKMACSLSLFAGTRKKKPGGGYKRGDIHVLFVGDPGTGKSEILKSAIEVSPRGLYTSGKGSTAVGLTAAVIKEADTGQMNLEAGVVVLANGGVAAIDEFDKMDTADRSALHEAMEQQSYHYDTEILSVDGKRIIIGEFIDRLMEKNKEQIICGKDCEILKYNNLTLYTTDFKKIFKTYVNRVSRHKSPEFFYKITFTNGRSIQVTPEHPLFIYRNGVLNCIRAENCVSGDFIPVPKYLPNSSDIIQLHGKVASYHPLAKDIIIPRHLNLELSRILGYIVSEGHSYKGSGAEIGFSNMNDALLKDFYNLMKILFDIKPSINERDDGLKTLRYISINLYEWMVENFPEVMTLSKYKRIPNKILSSSRRIGKEFLISAFKGDGSVESTAICYRTASKGLCIDYQDLLLKLGIHSRITYDKYNDSYKVYIRAQSLIQFYKEIIEDDDPRIKKIRNLIKPEIPKTNHHEVFPTSIIEMIIYLKKDLAIAYDGYFYRHLKKLHGITRNVFQKELSMIKDKYIKIKSIIDKKFDITEIRIGSGYSQETLGHISGISRGNIDYYERGGYDKKQREKIYLKIRSTLSSKIKTIEKKINYLESLLNSEINWDRIKSIKRIQNKGKNYTPWVYDITVEPNHTFISQGVILHNTVSIAKAGIVATLKAQTAIIAAANPYSGRYDIYKTPTQNIRLPPSLLSRFDLIFVVVDKPNAADDAQMAEFILKNSMMNIEESLEDDDNSIAPISRDLLKKYIKHARRTYNPILTDEAKERIKEFYLKLRGQYDSEDAIISILARNLDALVRLSESYAKMALRDKVLKEDVEEIINLFKRYLKDTGYDETTGKIDMDRIFVGQSRSSLNKLETLMNRLKEIFEENDWKALEKTSVIQILDLEETLDRKFIESALEELIKEGTLYEPRSNQIKFTNKVE
ncbi:MAG: LAGLIDADG family homing endonuclease [Promethearchaeota archaeon]